MEQSPENKTEFKIKLLNFFNNNKLKLLVFSLLIAMSIFIIIFINYKNKNENIQIAEKYVKGVIYLSANDRDNAKDAFIEVILSKNKFYSLIALNNLIEKELVKDKNEILNYFKILEKSKISEETKDLLVLKKALFYIKRLDPSKGESLLKQLIDKDSSLKSIAEELLKE